MTKHRQPPSPTPNVIQAREIFVDATEKAVKAGGRKTGLCESLLSLSLCDNGVLRKRVGVVSPSSLTATLLLRLPRKQDETASTRTRKFLLSNTATVNHRLDGRQTRYPVTDGATTPTLVANPAAEVVAYTSNSTRAGGRCTNPPIVLLAPPRRQRTNNNGFFQRCQLKKNRRCLRRLPGRKVNRYARSPHCRGLR